MLLTDLGSFQHRHCGMLEAPKEIVIEVQCQMDIDLKEGARKRQRVPRDRDRNRSGNRPFRNALVNSQDNFSEGGEMIRIRV